MFKDQNKDPALDVADEQSSADAAILASDTPNQQVAPHTLDAVFHNPGAKTVALRFMQGKVAFPYTLRGRH